MITAFIAAGEPSGGAPRRTDAEGHVLTGLWKEFSGAEQADRPLLEQEILEKILTESQAGKLYWDYACAAEKWYGVVTDRNWKLRDSCRSRILSDVAALDCPILTYTVKHRLGGGPSFSEIDNWLTNRSFELKKSSNTAFYSKGLSNFLPAFIVNEVTDDYMFLLWAVSRPGNDGSDASERASALLDREIAGTYPAGAYLEFLKILADNPLYDYDDYEILPVPLSGEGDGDMDIFKSPYQKRQEAIKAFSEKYRGRAIALLSDQQILVDRVHVLDNRLSGDSASSILQGTNPPTSADFVALRADCAALKAGKDAFSAGKDAKSSSSEALVASCAEDIDSLIRYLDQRNVRVGAKDDGVTVLLQNAEAVRLELSRGGEVFRSVVLDNPVNSYYLTDTVKYAFPDCPDGEYGIEATLWDKSSDAPLVGTDRSDRLSDRRTYEMHSISIAHREIDTGTGIYIADYRTGRPIETATVEIRKGSQTVLTAENLAFDGFTSIQELLESVADPTKRELLRVKCSYTDENGWRRESEELSFWVRKGESAEPADVEPALSGRIFKDRAAFNPGDSVQFKVLVYRDLPDGGMRVAEEGRAVGVRLRDPDANVVDTLDLTTNEFGSVAGTFALREDFKGGTYYILAFDGQRQIASTQLTLDEFTLPSYDLEFDRSDTPWFCGDTVSVRGTLKSYSGHALSSVKVAYGVECLRGESFSKSGTVFADASGRFEICFPTGSGAFSSERLYRVTVRATALDGETWEWSKYVAVNPFSSLGIAFSGLAGGDAREVERGGGADGYGGGEYNEGEDEYDYDEYEYDPCVDVLSGDGVGVTFNLSVPGLDILPVIDVRYVVCHGGAEVLSGTATSGVETAVSLAGLPSGLYRFEAEGEFTSPGGHCVSVRASETVLKTSDADSVIARDVDWFYKKSDNGRVALQLGTSEPRRWFVVEAIGSGKESLRREILELGTESESVHTVDYEYDESWPDAVRLLVFSFFGGLYRSRSFLFERPVEKETELPLSFGGFTDRSLPHGEFHLNLRTWPGVEAAVAVYDLSSETIRSNAWSAVRRYVPSFDVGLGTSVGSRTTGSLYWGSRFFSGSGRYWDGGPGFDRVLYEEAGPMLMSRAASGAVYDADGAAGIEDVEDAGDVGVDEDVADVAVRDGMDRSSVFLPFLRSDSEGRIEADFTASDRLSKFRVAVFAHDGKMHNSVLTGDFTVSLPVEVSLAQPQFLRGGDVYRLRAAVSNSDDCAYGGTMALEVYDTENYKDASPILAASRELAVEAGGAAWAEFEVKVPADVDTLGFKVVFSARASGEASVEASDVASGGASVSDGVFVAVPVYAAEQEIVEAHSAVVSGDADEEAVKASLAEAFTGIDASGAEYSEVSLVDLVKAAIPSEIETKGEDVLSLCTAFYAGRMAEYLSSRANEELTVTEDAGELWKRILSCANPDGGFGWYEGFKSSPILTAVVLERFATLSERGLIPSALGAGIGAAMGSAVRWLDDCLFSGGYAAWCGGLSLEQYLRVRVMYPDVEFSPSVPASASASASASVEAFGSYRSLKRFRQDVGDYLLPKDRTSLNGCILAKSRRVEVSRVLVSERGAALAGAWGLGPSLRKISKAVDGDMVSLSEYAVEHSSGGMYYPNAVLPFRGLLESEAYAHVLLCDLLDDYAADSRGRSGRVSGSGSGGDSVSDGRSGRVSGAGSLNDNVYHKIAEGIRVWLMVQKESQRWDDDPAFIDAVRAVLDGSAATLGTKVAVLTKRYSKPLGEIVAAGNGFTVSRTFYRVPASAGTSGAASVEASGAASVEASGVASVEASGVASVEASGVASGYGAAGVPGMVELRDGDVLEVGDRVTAVYRVWNGENRSFVRLETPRHAALRPVEQLSGRVGGLMREILLITAGCWYYPCAYREVKADRTILNFDVLAEENSSFSEDFFVTQAGVFSSPAVTVECVYAPHYRANDSASPALRVR